MSVEKPGAWPWTAEEFERWVGQQTWIDAASKTNPHQYALRKRSPSPREFEKAVLHIREFGFQGRFGGQEYSYIEAAGWRFWTMQDPIEFTLLVDRKPLKEEPNMTLRETLPQLFTSRFLATDVLSSDALVPVRISMIAPEPLLGELPYSLEHEVRALMPERRMYGEWPKFSPEFWRFLDETGAEKIAKELSDISTKNEDRALVLLCFEDLLKGQRCHRTIVAAWLEERTGIAVLELTDAGEVLALQELHPQVMPVRPR